MSDDEGFDPASLAAAVDAVDGETSSDKGESDPTDGATSTARASTFGHPAADAMLKGRGDMPRPETFQSQFGVGRGPALTLAAVCAMVGTQVLPPIAIAVVGLYLTVQELGDDDAGPVEEPDDANDDEETDELPLDLDGVGSV